MERSAAITLCARDLHDWLASPAPVLRTDIARPRASNNGLWATREGQSPLFVWEPFDDMSTKVA